MVMSLPRWYTAESRYSSVLTRKRPSVASVSTGLPSLSNGFCKISRYVPSFALREDTMTPPSITQEPLNFPGSASSSLNAICLSTRSVISRGNAGAQPETHNPVKSRSTAGNSLLVFSVIAALSYFTGPQSPVLTGRVVRIIERIGPLRRVPGLTLSFPELQFPGSDDRVTVVRFAQCLVARTFHLRRYGDLPARGEDHRIEISGREDEKPAAGPVRTLGLAPVIKGSLNDLDYRTLPGVARLGNHPPENDEFALERVRIGLNHVEGT